MLIECETASVFGACLNDPQFDIYITGGED